MDEELLNAYKNTAYYVDVYDKNVFIGQSHPWLDEVLRQIDASTWAFITAWNPQSNILPLSQNQQRQSELIQQVNNLGLIYFTGRGIPLSGDWTPEESLLILNLKKTKAVALGLLFNQNAIIFGKKNQSAELVWLNNE